MLVLETAGEMGAEIISTPSILVEQCAGYRIGYQTVGGVLLIGLVEIMSELDGSSAAGASNLRMSGRLALHRIGGRLGIGVPGEGNLLSQELVPALVHTCPESIEHAKVWHGPKPLTDRHRVSRRDWSSR